MSTIDRRSILTGIGALVLMPSAARYPIYVPTEIIRRAIEATVEVFRPMVGQENLAALNQWAADQLRELAS
jgi:hypothetical protein